MKQHSLSQVRNNIQLPFPSSTYYQFARKIIYVNNHQSRDIWKFIIEMSYLIK